MEFKYSNMRSCVNKFDERVETFDRYHIKVYKNEGLVKFVRRKFYRMKNNTKLINLSLLLINN